MAVAASKALPGERLRALTPVGAVLALGGIPLGLLAYRIQVEDLGSPAGRAAATVALGWAFLAAGLVAWSRRPGNRLGPLMAATGIALLLRQLRYTHDPRLFTAFFALGDVSYALIGHAALAYPSGRLHGRPERLLAALGYATVLAFPLAILLVHDGSQPLLFFDPSRRESLLVVAASPAAVEALQQAFVVLFYGVVATLFIALIARRLLLATPRARRILAPLLLAATVVGLRAVFESVFAFVDRPFAYDVLFWWQISALLALPGALLLGLLRARLAQATVGDLVLELQRTPPEGLRDALARALEDPTLEVVFWLPEGAEFADAEGRPVRLPGAGKARAVTRLEHEGKTLAALVHDPSLLDEPRLVEQAGAAARLALENARLQAELRAQLAEVQASRRRLVEAIDGERRRIERDIHDGAQQQLLALGLRLRQLQGLVGADGEAERLVASVVDDLGDALEGLRDLARGVHPPILTDRGLAAALESLAARLPLAVEVDATPQRQPARVEATAYFVACEALTNTVRHAEATRARVAARPRDGVLVVEVEDDGRGGARIGSASGLRGLADRVEGLGGSFTVESPPGGGTRVVAEVPCGP